MVLLIALAAIALALLLSLAKKALEEDDEHRKQQIEEYWKEQAEKEKRKQEQFAAKREAVVRKGGLLAQELQRSGYSPEIVEILYLAATQKHIKFDLSTEVRREVVPYPTTHMDYVQLTDVAHLPTVSPDQMILDDDVFYQRFVDHQLLRPEYSELKKERKRLYILLDISPSMYAQMSTKQDESMRIVWARGVIASLLLDAVEGEAEYYLRLFADDIHNLISVKNREEARNLLRTILDNSWRADGTNIGRAIDQAASDIRLFQSQGKTKINHILLITDGEDNSLAKTNIEQALGDDIQLHVVRMGSEWSKENPLNPYLLAHY